MNRADPAVVGVPGGAGRVGRLTVLAAGLAALIACSTPTASASAAGVDGGHGAAEHNTPSTCCVVTPEEGWTP